MSLKERHTTWILLRGLARQAGHWGRFKELFEKSVSPQPVLTIDLPGAGEFFEETSPANISGIMQFVRGQAILKSEPGSKLNLVAVSLGAMVAMQWLKERPGDLASAVLVNSSERSQSAIFERLRWQIWPKLLGLPFASSVKRREELILALVSNDQKARDELLAEWVRLAELQPVGTLSLLNQLKAAALFQGLSEPVDVPVLVVRSLGDRFVDPACSERLAKQWDWPLISHSWGGHDLAIDDPEWLVEQIKVWSQSLHNAQS